MFKMLIIIQFCFLNKLSVKCLGNLRGKLIIIKKLFLDSGPIFSFCISSLGQESGYLKAQYVSFAAR